MPITAASEPRLRTRTALAVAVPLAIAAVLRLDQFAAQVLIDDEWHAIHRVLYWTPTRMFLDFNIADYSIPLGLADWAIAHAIGLTELRMRVPMLVAGLATVALFPWAVMQRLGVPTAFAFALLLAASPMLVIYSQTARPYALTLLLGWVAHAAFQRAWVGSNAAGVLYAACAALATWLHPVIGPFVVAPFAWALWQLHALPHDARSRAFRRLCALAVGTALPMFALVLPPLLARPAALGEKSGFGLPTPDTLVGVAHWWLGTGNGWIVLAALALAAVGVVRVWRALPEARTGVVGLALTLGVAVLARPQFIEHVPTLGRYLLPALPLLLLAVAAGSVALAERLARSSRARAGGLVVLSTILPATALAATSPLPSWLARPNSYRLALHNHFDFRPRTAATYHEGIPLSPYWTGLARTPTDTLRIAAAPFFFESYHWDAHRWERASGQRVIPGFLAGLCVELRFGEVPRHPAFRLVNAVHLADAAALARAGIDHVAWQKPYRHPSAIAAQPDFAAVAHCERALRDRFAVVYEDEALVVFRAAGK